jgi:hypothetical protein
MRSQLNKMLNSLMVSDVFIFLVTVKHGVEEHRFTQMHTTVTSRGKDYKPYGLQIQWPNPKDALPKVNVVFDNVDRELVQIFRKFTDAPTITVELTTSLDPNIVEKSYADIQVNSVSYDAMSIQVAGTVKNMLSKAFPYVKYDVPGYPGIHYN